MTAPIASLGMGSSNNLKIRLGGVWIPVTLHMKKDGVIQLASVKARSGGSWVS